MDKSTAARITSRVTAKHRTIIPARPDLAMPSPFRTVPVRLANATHGVIRRVQPVADLDLATHSHGLILQDRSFLVPIGLAIWVHRHARTQRGEHETLWLIREKDLLAQHLLPSSTTVVDQVPHSRYREIAGRWNRSRSNRWGSEDGAIDATPSDLIGFISIGETEKAVLKTLGAKVNLRLRRMTLLP
jgi:hypothetical protein